MRRLVASLLAILVLVLSCIPCCDAGAIPEKGMHAAAIKAAPDKSGDITPDLCSPFCTCSCCAGITLPATADAIPLRSHTSTERSASGYSLKAATAVFFPVWQPPQLG